MNLPSQIGRYHVLGRIAYGGMAEILLAKVLGPGGFERPVVIKRALPHMAAESEFRDMFLDEARIVASLHHPNVVQVHELGCEDDELYLVMEYLAGESVRSLCARAGARGLRMNLGLCAHIVAEACAGLHAAHEFTGPDGKLLQVVHRDVCPNNLIVTYEGSVKVVDFGIALAADRFTATSAGQVKGKAAYMAPEQCLGRPIDRRTDVYALGVVLYELSTGHRLFGDALESRVVACLKDEEVPAPSSVIDGYPKELEQICLRALRNAPAERYASAEEMRRELVRFQRDRSNELLPEEQLRRCMRELFEDRIGEKADMVRQLRAGSIAHIPAAEISDEMAGPIVQTDRQAPSPGSLAEYAQGRGATAPIPGMRKRGVIFWSAFLILSACLATAGLLFVVEPAGGPPRLAEVPKEPARSGVIAPTAPKPPASVRVEVSSIPPGAEVWLDDELRGVTPLTLELPRSDQTSRLRLVLAGHEPLEQTLSLDMNQRLSLALLPAAPVAMQTSALTASELHPEGEVEAESTSRSHTSRSRAEREAAAESTAAQSAAPAPDKEPSDEPAKTADSAGGQAHDKDRTERTPDEQRDKPERDEFFLYD